MKTQSLLLMVFCLTALSAHAAKVIEIDEDEAIASVSPEKLNNPSVDEKLCFYRKNDSTGKIERVSCGTIVEMGANQVKAKFTDMTKKPKIGDFAQTVKEKKAETTAAATTEEKREPSSEVKKEEKAPEKLAEKPAEAASPAPSATSTAEKKSDSRDIVKPLAFGINAGAHVGTVYYDYQFNIQLIVHGHVGVGIQPSFGTKTAPVTDVVSTWTGVMLTVDYYHQPNQRGFWMHLGSGLAMISTNDAGTVEASQSPAFEVTMGWYERWAHNLNIGLSVGYQYIAATQRPTLVTGFAFAQPVAMGTIGFMF